MKNVRTKFHFMSVLKELKNVYEQMKQCSWGWRVENDMIDVAEVANIYIYIYIYIYVYI